MAREAIFSDPPSLPRPDEEDAEPDDAAAFAASTGAGGPADHDAARVAVAAPEASRAGDENGQVPDTLPTYSAIAIVNVEGALSRLSRRLLVEAPDRRRKALAHRLAATGRASVNPSASGIHRDLLT